MLRGIAIFSVVAVFVQLAHAYADDAGQTITLSGPQAAQLLIANNRLSDAKTILLQSLASQPDDSETLFLLGAVAVAEKDYDRAVSYYRRILVNEPDAERVRLELARAFFLKGDYDNAERQFRFARAGDESDAVKTNIDRFLSAISRLREWTFNFSVGLAPDTNENSATNIQQVNIYGLPFSLTSSALQHSGVGATGEIGGEWSPLLTDSLKARVGVDAYRADYSGSNFDDMTVSNYAGPQLLFDRGDVSALLTDFQRWYGNLPYASGLGGRLSGNYELTPRLLLSGQLSGQYISYHEASLQNGALYTSQLQGTYILSPSSLFQALAGLSRQNAEFAPYASNGYWIGGSYQRDLPYGFSASIQPSFIINRYQAPLAAFGVTRVDNTVVLRFDALNRRISYYGFTPKFSYIFADNQSNIPLYKYTRNQFNIGLTTQF